MGLSKGLLSLHILTEEYNTKDFLGQKKQADLAESGSRDLYAEVLVKMHMQESSSTNLQTYDQFNTHPASKLYTEVTVCSCISRIAARE